MQREIYGLTRDEIRALTRPSNLAGAWALVSTWAILCAAFAALALWPHPVMFVLAVIVIGGRQLALAVAMHEAAHGTLFRTKWCNDVLTDLVAAAPVWSDVARYRKHHLGHHAHTGTERDPDLSLAPERLGRASLVRKILRDVTGIAGLRRVIALLLIDLELLTFNVGGEARLAGWRGLRVHGSAAVRNLWKPALTNVALYAALAACGIGWMYWAWVVAYLTMFSLVLRVRSLAEHAGMARTDDPLRNTRTTHASLLARVAFAPLYVNYHLEHHLLPTVPWFRLPAMNRMLRERGIVPEASVERGYARVLGRISAST